jgi:hypothetical protein
MRMARAKLAAGFAGWRASAAARRGKRALLQVQALGFTRWFAPCSLGVTVSIISSNIVGVGAKYALLLACLPANT